MAIDSVINTPSSTSAGTFLSGCGLAGSGAPDPFHARDVGDFELIVGPELFEQPDDADRAGERGMVELDHSRHLLPGRVGSELSGVRAAIAAGERR